MEITLIKNPKSYPSIPGVGEGLVDVSLIIDNRNKMTRRGIVDLEP
jgi:hypothetical protein